MKLKPHDIQLLVLILACSLSTQTGQTAESHGFNEVIRPILSRHCLACHGPDAAKRKADLRLDIPSSALQRNSKGQAAILPGDPLASLMVQRMHHPDPEERMPPTETGLELTKEEKESIEAWIREGATYEKHWAFEVPKEIQPPSVVHQSWVRNPIDQFVLNQWMQRELTPHKEAPKAVLFRRASLTLTGLPPDPHTLKAYLENPDENAYEKWVDHLMESPRYGEHRARYWLDAARYGDTHGLHLDNERAIWPYRDWVVKAMNQNKRFDDFTIEQIAGDLLPNPSIDQLVATGFNRCNVSTGEGGAIPEEFAVRYAVDRINTLGTVWMGLTVGCSQCHDHKFDPITQKEYYQLFAFYNQLDENPMDRNALLYPPTIALKTPQHEQQLKALDQRLAAIEKTVRLTLASMDVEKEPGLVSSPTERDYVWVDDALPEGAKPSSGDSEWVFVSGAAYPVQAGIKSHRRKASGSSQHFFTEVAPGLRVGPEDTLFSWVYLDPNDPPQSLMLQFYSKDWNHRAYWGKDRIEHGKGGQATGYQHLGDLPPAGQWYRLEVKPGDVGLEPGVRITGWAFTQYGGTVFWDQAGIHTSWPQEGEGFESFDQWFHFIRGTHGASLPDNLQALFGKDTEKPGEGDLALLRDHFLRYESSQSRFIFQALEKEKESLLSEKKAVEQSIPRSMVSRERAEPRDTFMLYRGEYDKPGEKVSADVPAMLPPLGAQAPRNRLGLAQWLVNGKHPLTARVMINRIWQEHFGHGLVRTPEDFGTQGALPTHPQLLDWLAQEWIRSGWDMKHIHRLIVTSATYRQDSGLRQETLKHDPDNRWLSRGPRYRMDAEMIRDSALWIGGLLVETEGGRGVKPYQPAGLWKAVAYPSSSTANFVRDDGDALYRRSLYTFFKRTSPPPGMTLLDAPNREACMVKRERTNTPLQALHLMNDVQYVEAARGFAEWITTQGTGPLEHQVEKAMIRAVARKPDPTETQWLVTQWQDHHKHFQAHPEEATALVTTGEAPRLSAITAPELAAWTMIANLLLNLDEALTLH